MEFAYVEGTVCLSETRQKLGLPLFRLAYMPSFSFCQLSGPYTIVSFRAALKHAFRISRCPWVQSSHSLQELIGPVHFPDHVRFSLPRQICLDQKLLVARRGSCLINRHLHLFCGQYQTLSYLPYVSRVSIPHVQINDCPPPFPL
jgi:hypothetical protein